MIASDDLFQLIHSMTGVEKRQFKLFAAQKAHKRNSNYTKLFDVLNSMTEWDKQTLFKRLKHTQFRKHLATTKNQLYHLILESLSQRRDQESNIQQLINKAEVLFNHGLFKQSAALSEKALLHARKYEQLIQELACLRLQRLLFFTLEVEDVDHKMKELLALERQVTQRLSNESEFRHLYSQVVLLSKTMRIAAKPELRAALEDLMSNSLVQNASKALTFNARRDYFRIHVSCSMVLGKSENAWAQQNNLLALWDVNPLMREFLALEYKRDLRNSLQLCVQTRRFPAALALAAKIEELPPLSAGEAADTARSLVQFRLFYYLQQGSFAEAMQEIGTIEDMLNKHAGRMPLEALLGFYFNIAVLYFFNADFHGTIAWTSKITEHLGSDYRVDLQIAGQVLLLVAHYECADFIYLESLIRSIRRKRKKTDISEFELLILQLLTDLAAATENAKRQIFVETHSRLAKLAQASSAGNISGLTELQFWMESKLQNISLTELLRAKVSVKPTQND